VTFTVNANANGFAPGVASNPIYFYTTTCCQGMPARLATLTVYPPFVVPQSNMVASGTQGGPFSPSSFQYQLSSPYTISGVPNWLTPSSTSGTATSSGTTVTFTVMQMQIALLSAPTAQARSLSRTQTLARAPRPGQLHLRSIRQRCR
jgi:hypothetical protein